MMWLMLSFNRSDIEAYSAEPTACRLSVEVAQHQTETKPLSATSLTLWQAPHFLSQ
jgi:thiamine monophosphate kinase